MTEITTALYQYICTTKAVDKTEKITGSTFKLCHPVLSTVETYADTNMTAILILLLYTSNP